MMQSALDSLTALAVAAADRADSLPVRPAAEPLLSGSADSILRAGAELPAGAVDTLAAAEPFDPVLTAEQAFGTASELAAGTAAGIPFAETLTDHPVFQGIVLLLAVAYMLMICAHFHDIAGLFSRRHNDYVREGGVTFGSDGSVQTAAVIGLLMTAVLAVRFAERTPGALYGTMGVLLSALAAVFGIALFQCGALHLIGRITLSTDLTRALVHFKVLYLGLATVVAMPSALLLALCPPGEGQLWFYGTLLLSGTVAMLFLKESFRLFLAKKVSILHWFLYLCTVECFPISLIWLLATRY